MTELTSEEKTLTEPEHLDLRDPHFRSKAYDTYADMRARGPVARVRFTPGDDDEDDGGQARDPFRRPVFMVTRYQEAVEALLDERFTMDARTTMTPEQLEKLPPTPEEFRPLSRSILSVDPPDHTRLRKLVQPSFSERAMKSLRPRVRQIAEDLLIAAERAAAERGEAHPDRQMDLIESYAYPLPITVISELLGVPEEDRANIRRWSEAIFSGGPARDQGLSDEARASLREFTAYLRDLFERKRHEPTDDLISQLVHAEEDGDVLSEDELLSMVFILIVAGHITTVNLIGNAVLALLTHPNQLERLKQDPTLAKVAVEETLRYWGPAETVVPRFAREDIQINGTCIPKGEPLMVSLASADRDPARFPDPDEFELDRAEANRHIAFGKGIHMCLGAPLARLEGQIALNVLFARMPDLRLAIAPEEVAWRAGFLRGIDRLPIRF
jgi:cytochrome P450